MDFKELLGCGYIPFSRKADCQRSINVYREVVESGDGINSFVMYKTPGLTPAIQPNAALSVCRGSYELNDHVFVVIDNTLYDITFAAGVYTLNATYGPLANDGLPVVMAASETTLMIVSAKTLYRLSGVLTTPAVTFTPIDIAFIDNYFVALAEFIVGVGSQFFFNRDDGVTWDPADVQDAEASANALLALNVQNQVLYLYGNRITQPFLVGTNPNAPFDPQQNAVIPYGIKAPRSLAQVGNYRFWLGRNLNGEGVVYRGDGYSVRRVSDHALENHIREYEKTFGTADAIGMAYQQNGHEKYRIVFPAADASWELNSTVMDATGKAEWYEVLHWDFKMGQYHRHRSNTIVSAFGKILTGDYANGWLYELDLNNYTDYGFPQRWERQCPHILQENKRVVYDRLEIGAETGVGLSSPLWLNNYSMDYATFVAALAAAVAGGDVTADQALVLQAIYDVTPYTPLIPYPTPAVMQSLGFFEWGTDPQIRMKYSDDGAKSFNQELSRSLGRSGEDVEVFWDRLGAARDRVYNINGDEPCKLALTIGWLEAEALAS